MPDLAHYTITTGHLRMSPRSEVPDDVIDVLRPLLVTGEHVMPHPPGGYRLRVTVDGTALAATVLTASGVPLATTTVAPDAESLTHALRATGAKPAKPISAPAALVDVYPTLSTDHSASRWVGDFERCIAWSWNELLAERNGR